MTNIGVGLLSPCTITISMLVGSVISYGILLPYIEYMQGIIGISMVLADGAFHLLCILLRTLRAMRKRRHSQLATQPFMCLGVDDRRRAQVFLRDRVYDPAAAVGYVALSVVSIAVVPYLYPQLRPAHVAIAYLVVPLFTFCNAYGVGVTDVSVASTYGRIALFLLGSWVGLQNGGVVAGLAVGIIVMSAASTASDLMQVFRTGYLTLTSPHAVLISQVAGTALGCLVNPIIFWVLYGGYHDWGEVVVPPYAKMYREMAMIAMSDQAGFPRQSLLLCKIAFAVALANSVLREVSARRGWRVGRYLPYVHHRRGSRVLPAAQDTHRHVLWERRHVPVEEARCRRRARAGPWRWQPDSSAGRCRRAAAVHARDAQGATTDLHHVPVSKRQQEPGCLPGGITHHVVLV